MLTLNCALDLHKYFQIELVLSLKGGALIFFRTNHVDSFLLWRQCSAYAGGIKGIVTLCFQMYVVDCVYRDQIIGKSEILSSGSDFILHLVSLWVENQ